MARDSVRRKIMYHFREGARHCDEIQKHLKMLDDLQDGRHKKVEAWLPLIVDMTETLKTSLLKFRAEI